MIVGILSANGGYGGLFRRIRAIFGRGISCTLYGDIPRVNVIGKPYVLYDEMECISVPVHRFGVNRQYHGLAVSLAYLDGFFFRLRKVYILSLHALDAPFEYFIDRLFRRTVIELLGWNGRWQFYMYMIGVSVSCLYGRPVTRKFISAKFVVIDNLFEQLVGEPMTGYEVGYEHPTLCIGKRTMSQKVCQTFRLMDEVSHGEIYYKGLITKFSGGYLRLGRFYNLGKLSWKDDIFYSRCVGKQWGYIALFEAGNAASYAGYIKCKLGMRCRKVDKFVDVGLYRFHSSLHGGDGITLPLQAFALPPYCTKLAGGNSCGSTGMCSCQIAAEDKYLMGSQ